MKIRGRSIHFTEALSKKKKVGTPGTSSGATAPNIGRGRSICSTVELTSKKNSGKKRT